MDSKQLKQKYLDFFKSKNHKIINSASLIPEHDPTVLFTTAGMHPLVPFLLGQPHPSGKRLADVQKCIRTGDIDDVGDNIHLTFFEMLGNWSLGDYFKKEAIEWSFEFLTSKKWLGIDINRLGITCFAGGKDAPKDEESAKVWMSLGIPKERIFFLPKEDNWWGPAGETGPCGPCTEMFYWVSDEKPPVNFDPKDKRWMEIWNDVFMEYNKKKDGKYEQLKQKNVDTGMGVERTITALQGKKSVYETALFLPIVKELETVSGKLYGANEGEKRAMRIILDHVKAATFILGDDLHLKPSNVERGYVLRRLIRRAIRYGKELGIIKPFTSKLAQKAIEIYRGDYPELKRNSSFIAEELDNEEDRFRKVIEDGIKRAEKIFSKKTPIEKSKFLKLMQLKNKSEMFEDMFRNKKSGKNYSIKEVGISEKEIDGAIITGDEAFKLYQSFGFPIELITELVREKHLLVDVEGYEAALKRHQELSRTASAGVFKSGLADNSEATTRLHTATHLLNEALRQVVSKDIAQKGSNITPERLRFDFNFDRKLTSEELKKAEELVNQKIKEKIPVIREEMTVKEAKAKGAQAEFEEKYGEKVSVYTIGKFSCEICMGPHVKNTSELGHFKIIKEESIAAGVRRIKAVLE